MSCLGRERGKESHRPAPCRGVEDRGDLLAPTTWHYPPCHTHTVSLRNVFHVLFHTHTHTQTQTHKLKHAPTRLRPLLQVEVQSLMEAKGQTCVGWYHSHPVFEPSPSQKDMDNQRNYQALFK